MTKKSLDRQNRFRSKTYGFRLSPEENEVLERNVLLSGLTKQDYLIHCIEQVLSEASDKQCCKAFICTS